MSCVSERNELALSGNIAARARALREGRLMPELEVPARPEFQSAPDAEPMLPEDICNIGLLPSDVVRRELEALALSIWDWDDTDERWELTPHELNKLREKKITKYRKAL